MALPIVGKFFQKTFSSSKFYSLKNLYFQQPSEENLALLDIPKYKEILEIEKKIIDIRKIFRRDKPEEQPKVQEKPIPGEKEPEEEKVWEKIKRIFKKKK